MFEPRSDANHVALRNIKAMARSLFQAREDDAVVVNELRCTEPGCPPIETVVALLRAGTAPWQVKIHEAAGDITEDELRAAIRGDAQGGHAEAAADPASGSKLPGAP